VAGGKSTVPINERGSSQYLALADKDVNCDTRRTRSKRGGSIVEGEDLMSLFRLEVSKELSGSGGRACKSHRKKGKKNLKVFDPTIPSGPGKGNDEKFFLPSVVNTSHIRRSGKTKGRVPKRGLGVGTPFSHNLARPRVLQMPPPSRNFYK